MQLDYIYIIADNHANIKVGVSHTPERRLKQLQTGNQNKLTLLFTEEFYCTRKHILRIENAIHKELHRLTENAHGEWFKLTEDNIEKIKNLIVFYRIRYESDLTAFEKCFK